MRQIRGNLIGVFKMLKGYDAVETHTFFELLKVYKRSFFHSLNLCRTGCNLDCGKCIFMQGTRYLE
jgi:hypothetical protein